MALLDPLGNESSGNSSTNVGYEPPTGGVTGTTTPPPITSSQPDARTGITNAYQTYLGRAPQEYEYGWWTGNPDYETGIKNSPEAQARTRNQAYQPTYRGFEGVDTAKLNDPTHQTTKYIAARILAAGGSVQQAAQAVGGTVIDATRFRLPSGEVIDTRRDQEGANALQWLALGNDANAGNNWTSALRAPGGAGGPGGGPGAGPGAGIPSAQGSAFSDPATSQWEQMLRSMVDTLNTPVPDRTRELQQTQALDPLERQRAQQKQQMQLRLAQRGIQPGSGIYDEAMQNIDRQFNELRTRTQAGFANAGAQQEEQRRMQAVDLLFNIPRYQDTRLQLAQGTLIPSNPAQLLSLAQQNSQYNNAQNQAFFQWLGNALAQYFG